MSKTQAAKELLAKSWLKAKATVLNVSELAIKAQEATNNQKWGPHGQLMTGEYSDLGCDAAHDRPWHQLSPKLLLQSLLRAVSMLRSSRR